MTVQGENAVRGAEPVRSDGSEEPAGAPPQAANDADAKLRRRRLLGFGVLGALGA